MIKPIITNRKELSETCGVITTEFNRYEVIVDLKDTAAKLNNCTGLAAPQIGHKVRAILVNVQGKILIMINPEILNTKGKFSFGNEGCFSVPASLKTPRRVQRWFKVHVLYENEKGDVIDQRFKSFEARLIQHEIDHLDGILI